MLATPLPPPSSVLHPASSPARTSSLSPSRQSPAFQHRGGSVIRRRVTVQRSGLDVPWGFRLQGGKDFNAPLTVQRVFSGSPVSGYLTRDDVILTIDDQPVEGLTHAQVLERFRSAGNSIALTIETSPFESEFGHAKKFIAPSTGHQQQEQNQTSTEDTSTIISSQYATHQQPLLSTMPHHHHYQQQQQQQQQHLDNTKTTQYLDNQFSTNVYKTSDDFKYPKITPHSREQTVKKSPARTVGNLPTGLMQPGWVPRPKSVPLSSPSDQYHTQLSQDVPPQQPISTSTNKQLIHLQPRKTEQQRDVIRKDANYAAWHGSLRSGRSAHPWEMKTANILSPHEGGSHESKVQEPVQSPSRQVFKAEIRDLRLSHPSYKSSLSTPGKEETPEEQYSHSHYQALSAPQTPVSDTFSISSNIKALSCQDVNPAVPPSEEQVKIQPSVLFGALTTKRIQLAAPIKNTVNIRAGQSLQADHPKPAVISFSPAQPAPEQVPIQNLSTPARASRELVKQPIPVPVNTTKALHLPVTLEQKAEVKQVVLPTVTSNNLTQIPAEPFNPKSNQLEKLTRSSVECFSPMPNGPEKAQIRRHENLPAQVTAKIPQAPVERFNPVPDKLENIPLAVERFNPVPDRPEKLEKRQDKQVLVAKVNLGKIPQTPVERFNPVPDKLEKIPQAVERFNPVPDRPEKLQQRQDKLLLVAKINLTKTPQTPVERFNPVPDRLEKIPQAVERFNPVPDRPEKLEKRQDKQLLVAKVNLGKIPQTPVERFNPVPDKLQKFLVNVERFNPMPDRPKRLEQIQDKQLLVAKVNLIKTLQTPVERFNPVPDKLDKIPQVVERFNPVPDKNNVKLRILVV